MADINPDSAEERGYGNQMAKLRTCRQCGMKTPTPAERFLHEQIHAEAAFTPHGLNQLPFALCERVGKLMTDYAAEIHSRHEKAVSLLDRCQKALQRAGWEEGESDNEVLTVIETYLYNVQVEADVARECNCGASGLGDHIDCKFCEGGCERPRVFCA